MHKIKPENPERILVWIIIVIVGIVGMIFLGYAIYAASSLTISSAIVWASFIIAAAIYFK